MSNLSGFDSEAIGFDCISRKTTSESTNATQTSEFGEAFGTTQTNLCTDVGCSTDPEDFGFKGDINYSSLNQFLNRVVPCMMGQLDQNDEEFLQNSSDSDSEDTLPAKFLQEMKLNNGSGDHEQSILALSWSSAGNSIAMSIGQAQHDTWCESPGLIRIFTLKKSEGDKFVHSIDISEKNCISALSYHPSVAALLAYGTVSGEVVLCNLQNDNFEEGTQLTSPSGCHGSRRVSKLMWADASLTTTFMMLQIVSKKKRRSPADQVLLSSGSDGTLNAWQVNAASKIFENIVCYSINSSRNVPAPDITCFDFVKTGPLRPSEEKIPADMFVVGVKCGRLFLCKIEGFEKMDPVVDVLEAHSTCVLDLAFCVHRPGVFVSVSMDSELRIYDVNQSSPLKVICLDAPISCMTRLPGQECVALGVDGPGCVQLYSSSSGRRVPLDGITGRASCIAVTHSGSCRLATGNGDGMVRLWELPRRSYVD